jgi:hypothetical protein
MAYGDDQVSANPVARFGGIALGVGLFALGGFIPMLLTFVALFAVKKLFPRLSDTAVLFAGLAAGQWLWFVVGAAIAPDMWLGVAPDLIVGAALTAWFIARPSVLPAALLMAFELVGLGMNGWMMTQVALSSPDGKALILHMILRLAIIGSGIWYLRRRRDVRGVAEAFE